MKATDSNSQTRAGRGQPNESPCGDAPNVIPFPGTRTLRRQRRQTVPRSFKLILGQALRRVSDRLRRLVLSPEPVLVQPKPGADTAPAAPCPGSPQAKLPGHGGEPVRKRMSA